MRVVEHGASHRLAVFLGACTVSVTEESQSEKSSSHALSHGHIGHGRLRFRDVAFSLPGPMGKARARKQKRAISKNAFTLDHGVSREFLEIGKKAKKSIKDKKLN